MSMQEERAVFGVSCIGRRHPYSLEMAGQHDLSGLGWMGGQGPLPWEAGSLEGQFWWAGILVGC